MKKQIVLSLVAVLSIVVFSGCVPITYHKSVTVTKDGNGKITSIVETEEITEPHSEVKRIKTVDPTAFQNLK